MLYIATLALAKLSIISLLMILTASKFHHNLGLGLTCSIALWGILSVIVSAFQCGSFEPWRFYGVDKKCFNIVCCDILILSQRVADKLFRLPFGNACVYSTS